MKERKKQELKERVVNQNEWKEKQVKRGIKSENHALTKEQTKAKTNGGKKKEKRNIDKEKHR